MPGTTHTTAGAVGGGDLAAAAQEIAAEARRLASWSRQIPPSITVEVSGDTAEISTDVGPAYPAETRARHPLFAQGPRGSGGGWDHWYGPPGERFLGPAADSRAGAAMARYAKKIDRMCRARGFR